MAATMSTGEGDVGEEGIGRKTYHHVIVDDVRDFHWMHSPKQMPAVDAKH